MGKASIRRIAERADNAARGLFVRDETDQVVARGYEKFFNVGEKYGPASFEEIVERADPAQPIMVRRNYNGTLGIVAVVDGELRVWSKAGPTPFAEEAEHTLTRQLGEGLPDFVRALTECDVSVTFEVISKRDPHIVDEGESRLVLLDAITNSVEFTLDAARARELVAAYGVRGPGGMTNLDMPSVMRDLGV